MDDNDAHVDDNDDLQRGLQTSTDSASPSAELPASGKEPHPRYVGRNADGTTRPGYPGPALRKGLRSELVRAGVRADGADLRHHLRQRVDAIVADLGGDVGEVRREMIERFVELTAVADHLIENIIDHGVLTAKGRGRAASSSYLSVIDRLERLARTIGLERRRKHLTFAEQLRQAARENEAARERQRED